MQVKQWINVYVGYQDGEPEAGYDFEANGKRDADGAPMELQDCLSELDKFAAENPDTDYVADFIPTLKGFVMALAQNGAFINFIRRT